MLISGRKYKMKLKFGFNKGYTPPLKALVCTRGCGPMKYMSNANSYGVTVTSKGYWMCSEKVFKYCSHSCLLLNCPLFFHPKPA